MQDLLQLILHFKIKVIHEWTQIHRANTVADPGFPVGGRGPSTRALFSENVCENERIGSHREAHTGKFCM